MDSNDRSLGMGRSITRRDFINGVAVAIGGTVLAPKGTWASPKDQGDEPEAASDYYPPTRTGMRGDHPGSFETAHKMRDQRGWDLSGAAKTGESYDLVIVGGGISGLSAAHFFLSNIPEGRVLILDNHDDFGGHAKRNEFHYNGHMLALNGGR
jgi:spermidine dehydrogenase